MIKKIFLTAVLASMIGSGLAACSTDADVVNHNISQDADNFKVARRITFVNGITDKYLFTITGYCSLDASNPTEFTVTCDTNQGYVRDYLGKADNVTWIAEQLDPSKVSAKHYEETFKPESIVPDVEVR